MTATKEGGFDGRRNTYCCISSGYAFRLFYHEKDRRFLGRKQKSNGKGTKRTMQRPIEFMDTENDENRISEIENFKKAIR